MTKSLQLHRNHKLKTPEERLRQLEERYAQGVPLFPEGEPDWRDGLRLAEEDSDDDE